MNDTSVPTATDAPVSVTAVTSLQESKPQSARPREHWLIRRVLRPLASLRLTVVLFVLSLLLVFFGTMAQIDAGIGTVMKQYFRWWVVWVPWQLLVQFAQVFFAVDPKLKVAGAFPFPAGWTLGALLLVNLIAAHLVRFRFSWKRSGILLIHSGLIVLMLGELFTGLYAVEQRMSIAQGETVNFTDVSDSVELALLTPDPTDPAKDHVVVIPDWMVRQPGKRLRNDQLPFDVEIVEFWKNSTLIEPGQRPLDESDHPREGVHAQSGRKGTYGVTHDTESSGVDSEGAADTPSALVAFYRKDTDEKIAERFVSLYYYPNHVRRQIDFDPQYVEAGGTAYEVVLRPRREYKDYALTLKEFTHEKYQGTSTPKDFSSLVTVQGTEGERREVKIYMNNPLRYQGETFYQSAYFPGNTGTILQVVRNPAWLMPYVSCIIVTLGMLIHFGLGLSSFLARRAAS